MIGRLWRLVIFEIKKLYGRRFLLVPQGLYTKLPGPLKSIAAPPFVLIAYIVIIAAAMFSGLGEWVLDRARTIATGEGADPFKNAWSTLAGSASKAQFIAMIMLLILSGTSMAEEAQFGTMKAILTRPYRRAETILAKALTLSLFVVSVVFVLALAGLLTGSINYDFVKITDPSYGTVIVEASDMWKTTLFAFLLLIPPLFALVSFGIFLSLTIEQPGYSVGVAMGGVLVMGVLGMIYDSFAEYSFIHWSSVPLNILENRGASYTRFRFKLLPALKSIVVCFGYCAVFYGLSIWRLSVRDIGD